MLYPRSNPLTLRRKPKRVFAHNPYKHYESSPKKQALYFTEMGDLSQDREQKWASTKIGVFLGRGSKIISENRIFAGRFKVVTGRLERERLVAAQPTRQC
jgi:hypothetical protein